MRSFILAIDQGTSSSRAVVYSLDQERRLHVVAQGSCAFNQHYPHPSWVEHDLNEIWQSVVESVRQALDRAQCNAGVEWSQLACIGITNQRETLCFWDVKTAQPISRAIVWQCKRSEAVCAEWRELGYEKRLRAKTGLCIDPYFSATKLVWALKDDPQLQKDLESGQVLVGTIDSYLIYRLTKGQVFATEPSNASRTLLYALAGGWDRELVHQLGCPQRIYAHVKDSCGDFGKTDVDGILPTAVPITGVLGDQQAATLGQQCLRRGELKCTYGTGAFLMVQAGERPLISQSGLLTTVGWQVDGNKSYMLEGSTFIAGAGVAYLKDMWGFLTSVQDAAKVKTAAAPEVIFVPEFAGLGAPYWNSRVRGTLFGLSRDTSREQIVRALIEGVVFRVTDLVDAAAQDLAIAPSSLQVDGGMAANDLAMQFQADMLGVQVVRNNHLEATAYGVAIMAAYGCGLMPTLEVGAVSLSSPPHSSEVSSEVGGDTFTPLMTQAAQQDYRQAWQRALKAAMVFADA